MGLLQLASNFAQAKLGAYASKIFGKGVTDLGMPKMQTDPNLQNINYAVIIKQDQDAQQCLAPRIVVGAMPQSFQVAQSSDWKAPWGAGLAGEGTMGDILAVTGNRLVAQVLTMKVWQGSSDDFEFSVQFELRTWSDPEADVIQPIRTLLKMSMPSMSATGFLQSPGPILDAAAIEAIGGKLAKTATSILDSSKKAASEAKTKDGTTDWVGMAVGVKNAAIKTVSDSGIAKKSFIESNLKNKISIQLGRWFYLNNVVITNVQHEIKAQTPEYNSGLVQQASVTVSFKPMFALTAEDVDMMLRAGKTAINRS